MTPHRRLIRKLVALRERAIARGMRLESLDEIRAGVESNRASKVDAVRKGAK